MGKDGDLLDALIKKFNDSLAGNEKPIKYRTGLLPLDYVFDNGLQAGTITEIYGEPSTGKTTTALLIAKTFLNRGMKVIYMDTEFALDINWCLRNGLDINKLQEDRKLFIISPDTADKAYKMAIDSAKTGEVGCVIIDSIASLPVAEMLLEEDPVNFNRPGLSAKKQTNFLVAIKPILHQTKTSLVLINQVRANISPYGAPTSVPGSYYKRFASSYIIELKKKDIIGLKEQPDGIVVQIKNIKNKCGIPYRLEYMQIHKQVGLDIASSNMDYLIAHGLIKRTGAYYSIGEERFRGREELKAYLLEHSDVVTELVSKAEVQESDSGVKIIEKEVELIDKPQVEKATDDTIE